MTSLEELLEAERRAVDPGAGQVSRMEHRLELALGISAGAAAATTAAMVSTKASTVASKLGALWAAKSTWLWSVGAAAGVGLGYAAATVSQPTPQHQPPTEATSTLAAPASDKTATSKPQAIDLKESAEQPEPPVPSSPQETAQHEPARPKPASATPSSPAAPRPKAPATSPEDRLQRDARALSQISGALNQGAPARALSLLSEVSVQGSALAVEFHAARAIALCQLGRHAEAQGTVSMLKQRAPESPTLLRVTRACE